LKKGGVTEERGGGVSLLYLKKGRFGINRRFYHYFKTSMGRNFAREEVGGTKTTS